MQKQDSKSGLTATGQTSNSPSRFTWRCARCGVAKPSVVSMISTAASAAVDEAKAVYDGVGKVPESEKKRRMEICEACDQFDPSGKRCRKCGCFMALKTAMRSQACPIGKWGPQDLEVGQVSHTTNNT